MRKLAILGLALVPVMSASAQKQMTEVTVGLVSAGVTHSSGENLTSFDVGAQGLALAFYLSSGMAIEPMASFSYLHASGESSTTFDVGAGLPIYMKKDWGHTGLFIEPRVGIHYDKGFGATSSTSQFSFGGSVGYKMKVSDHVSTRVEGLVTDALSKGTVGDADYQPSATFFGAVFSISVFLGH